MKIRSTGRGKIPRKGHPETVGRPKLTKALYIRPGDVHQTFDAEVAAVTGNFETVIAGEDKTSVVYIAHLRTDKFALCVDTPSAGVGEWLPLSRLYTYQGAQLTEHEISIDSNERKQGNGSSVEPRRAQREKVSSRDIRSSGSTGAPMVAVNTL